MSEEKKKVLRGLVCHGAKIRSLNRFEQPNSASGENILCTLETGERITAWPGSRTFECLKRMRPGFEFDFSFKGMKDRSYVAGGSGVEQTYVEYLGVEIIVDELDVHLNGVVVSEIEEVPAKLKDLPELGFSKKRVKVAEVVDATAEDHPAAVGDSATATDQF